MARDGKYKFRNFIFDAVMCSFTAFFWLIWVFVRESQKNN